jgi:hypothetical protein
MIRIISLIAVFFALGHASVPDARAALCFQYTKSGGGISVAQADIPAPNQCQTFALYEVGTDPNSTLLGAGTGSLCTSTNSPMVIFHYTYEGCRPLGRDNYFESGTCRLQLDQNGNLPTQFSVCRGALITGRPGLTGKAGNFFNHDDLVITKCDSNDIKFQVPSGSVSECWTELKLRLQSSEEPSQSPDQPSRGSDQPAQSP